MTEENRTPPEEIAQVQDDAPGLLKTRTMNVAYREFDGKIAEILKACECDVLDARNAGVLTVQNLQDCLALYGLSLRECRTNPGHQYLVDGEWVTEPYYRDRRWREKRQAATDGSRGHETHALPETIHEVRADVPGLVWTHTHTIVSKRFGGRMDVLLQQCECDILDLRTVGWKTLENIQLLLAHYGRALTACRIEPEAGHQYLIDGAGVTRLPVVDRRAVSGGVIHR